MVLPICALDQSDSTLPAVLVDVSWRVRHVGHRPTLPVPCWQHPDAIKGGRDVVNENLSFGELNIRLGHGSLVRHVSKIV